MIYAVTKQQFIHESIQSCTLQDCIDYCMSIDEISIDTETKGFDPHSDAMLSIQLGDSQNQYFIEWETSYSTELLPLFQDKTKTFIFHNAKFDLKFLRKNNLLPDNIYDTMLAEAVLKTGYSSEQRDLSLKGVVKHYIGIDLDKTVRGEILWKGITPEVIIYGANDIKHLSKVKELQMNLISKWKLEKVLELENEVVKVFAKMEYDGITLNPETIKEVASTVEKEREEIIKKMDTLIYTEGTKELPNPNKLTKYCAVHKQGNLFFDEVQRDTYINWSSNKQVKEVLFQLDIEVESTDEASLQSIRHKHPIPELLLSYRQLDKLASSFGTNLLSFINSTTGKVHMDIWQILSTGRISTSKPNLNQIPAHGETATKIRSAFTPQPGYKIVGGDYSGRQIKLSFMYVNTLKFSIFTT